MQLAIVSYLTRILTVIANRVYPDLICIINTGFTTWIGLGGTGTKVTLFHLSKNKSKRNEI